MAYSKYRRIISFLLIDAYLDLDLRAAESTSEEERRVVFHRELRDKEGL